jgi:hypothetical protein
LDVLFLRPEGTHLGTQYGVFYSPRCAVVCVEASQREARLGNCNIGNVLSPHNVSLMKTVKLWNKEGNSLLLVRYSVLRVTSLSQDEPSYQVELGRYTVLGIIVD